MTKRHITIWPLTVCLLSVFAFGGPSPQVSSDQASIVAQNWIKTVIHHQKHWGGSDIARIKNFEPVMRKNRIVGYYVSIEPQGYIVVSARKEFAPIKCFSQNSSFDPTSNKGFADVVKSGLEKNLDALIERANGKALSKTAVEKNSVKYASTWDELQTPTDTYDSLLKSQTTSLKSLAQRGPLLESHWHQNWPYNDQCPTIQDCEYGPKRAPVGCVSTAASQIMNYWDWPPYGTGDYYDAQFDWTNILDSHILDPNDRIRKGPDGTPCTSENYDAVAFLCYTIGEGAGSLYGCDETTAWMGSKPGRDMTDAFKDYFRYDSNVNHEFRDIESASSWYYGIRASINSYGPLVYAIQTSWSFGGHAIACDGWMENGSLQMIHLNYGWGGATDGWYALDAIPESYATSTESIIENIRPTDCVGQTVSGTYPRQTFPWRYFNRTATGQNATFSPGQLLQFFPYRKLACINAAPNERISFQGLPTKKTKLFTKGDTSRGIRIDSGAINLLNGGEIEFRK